MLRIVVSDDDREGLELDLDSICRDGARKMLRTALRAEVVRRELFWDRAPAWPHRDTLAGPAPGTQG